MSKLLVGAFSYGAAPATDQGIWQYDTTTGLWTHVYLGVHHDQILNLAITPDQSLVMVTIDGSIPRIYSLDKGATWIQGGTQYNNTGTGPWGVIGVAEDKSIYDANFNAVSSTYKLIKSSDYGVTWIDLYDLVHGGFNVPHMIWYSRGHLWWTERWSSGPIKNSIIRDHVSTTDIAYTGATLIRGLYTSDLIWVWGDAGNNNRHAWKWDGSTLTDLSAGLPLPIAPWTATNQNLYSIVPFDDNTLFLADRKGNAVTDPTPNNYCLIYKSIDGGASWALVLDDIRAVFDAGSDGDGLYFITKLGTNEYAMVALGGIFHSTDGGNSWTFIAGPSATIEFSSIGAFPSKIRVPVSTVVGAT